MKLAIISGGSRGLGAALAEYYSNIRYEVLELSRSGSTEGHVYIDFSNAQNIIDTLPAILGKYKSEQFDEVLCFNNAATLAPIGATSTKPKYEILHNLNINFASGILFLTEFIRTFQNHSCKKTIINISSGAAVKGYNGWSLYCAAKAGLDNFIRSIALEQKDKSYPITSINFDPILLDTDMQKAIREASEQDFPEKKRFIEYKKSDALAEPKTVAKRIADLISRPIKGGQRYSANR
ncbi:MAG: SDR family NAD(P)-dependent oxidoreductase [Chloroflexi bacterium]|nr:SDR family NAD(P)-dependent oxidoreductase [Chloroflexota bacterium]MBT7081797.1 SDR family NAD(P)-dependent oxidoreductase [Chloroflexota bacterium]